jgi:hypothetical protein
MLSSGRVSAPGGLAQKSAGNPSNIANWLTSRAKVMAKLSASHHAMSQL